jgi:hypothetical protein
MDIHVCIHCSGHVTEWRKIVRFWCQREMQFSLSLPLILLSFPSTLGSEGMRRAESRQMSFASGELANFIRRALQVLPSIPRTTLNHYVYYYGLCHLFYNVNREWMPACLLRPIKISICRAEYPRTRYYETSVTYRYLEANSKRAQPLVGNQS